MSCSTQITPTQLATSFAYCCAVSRREAKNFYYSFCLLPAPKRLAMCALYAYLRRTDDIADGSGDVAEKAEALGRWRDELHQALTGHPVGSWPGWHALAETAERQAIPASYLSEVIDGVANDLEPRPFATFQDLDAYCYQVASVVGLSCLHIWGFRSEGGEAERRAEACGVALQLTNIIRDVREDALTGRVYLPLEDLRRFGVDPCELTAPVASVRVRALLEFEAERAAGYYRQSAGLAPLVNPEGRPALLAITGIYHRLLDEIIRREFDVFSRRVSLSPWRKLWITARSMCGRFAETGSMPVDRVHP